jgi:hypothetical protein
MFIYFALKKLENFGFLERLKETFINELVLAKSRIL